MELYIPFFMKVEGVLMRSNVVCRTSNCVFVKTIDAHSSEMFFVKLVMFGISAAWLLSDHIH